MVCIAHQYLVHHPAYPSPPGNGLNRRALQFFADVTATGATRRLALSFEPVSESVERRLAIVPPLLRNELFRMPLDRTEPFVLAYLLNSGYAPDLVEWHRRRPDVVLHCFWDKRDADSVYSPVPNLTFHRLDDRRFLDLMSRCTGLVCSAGFESICEAMYLGKPVMMVPVEGHFEQACNALDAVAAGAGITCTTYDVDVLMNYVPSFEGPSAGYRAWVESAPATFISHLESAANRSPASVFVAARP